MCACSEAKLSPTSRSLALLRTTGYTAAVVEAWVPGANVRRDLFYVADIVAAHPIRSDLLLVQATSGANVSARVNKAQRSLELLAWLRAGGRFEVWGWYETAEGWQVRRVELKGEQLAENELTPRKRRGRLPVQATLFDKAGMTG